MTDATLLHVSRAPVLDPMPHGFLGRTGGVSTGALASLNVGLGSQDDRHAIMENRRRAVEAIASGAQLVTLHQVHSAVAVIAQAAWPEDARPHADGVVTQTPGLVLGVLTADCAPVLFADARAGVVGAAHAGWKGALNGVIAATVEAMVSLGCDPSHICAAVGPCIARRSYEVDEVFRRTFEHADEDSERFFSSSQRDGHFQFDLEGYVALQLSRAGIQRVTALGEDTYSQPERYFSYRRSTHRAEPDYGRQISLISLPPSK